MLTEHKDMHLLLPGKDSLNGKCQNIIKKFKLNKQIHILGYRKDIPKLLKISNLALSAASQEGLPVNIMEAMYIGLPIVASDCRGNRDLVIDGVNGFLIELNDSNRFKKCIGTIFKNNRKFQNTMSKINNSYMLDKIVILIKNIYFPKVKVMHLLSSTIYSGAENVACNIIKELNNKYDVCYCSPKGKIEKKLNEESITYFGIKKMSYRQVKKAVNTFNPNVIHAHDNKATVYASFFHKECKIISHIHGNNKIMNTKNIRTLLFHFVSRYISEFIWVSRSAFDDYCFSKKIKNKSMILYNVVDDSKIQKKAKEYEIKKNFDLIFLGRLGYPKNPARLINIVEIIKTKKSNITLAIVGDGEEKDTLKNLVKEKKLEKNVKFFGYKSNPFPILFKSKIMVMTSLYEGTPMCALEAQALGKPIVATPVDGLKDIIIDGYNGYLVNNDEEFAERIIDVLKKDLKDNVLKVFEEKNNFKKYIETIERLY